MTQFTGDIQRELEEIHEAGLLRLLRLIDSPQGRSITVGGRALINFSSNDYLGLANHPVLKEAAISATRNFGAGSGASRLISGSLAPHHRLEETLAAFKGSEASLAFSSGYATGLGVIPALLAKDDVIIVDKLVHASIIDAARLSGAKLRVYRHNDVEDLEKMLKWTDARTSTSTLPARPRTLVVTESVFSMDGDIAPLSQIVALKEKYGAWLMVDEAHGTGLFGEKRRGVAEEQGVASQIEVQMGTLGKAIGSAGGYICGRRSLIDLLINRARSFIFSTAPPPAQSAAAQAGIELIQSGEGQNRRATLWTRARELTSLLQIPEARSAIVPVIVGEESEALRRAERLSHAGFFVPAIRYPTVARGSARLRVTVTAEHTLEDVRALAGELTC